MRFWKFDLAGRLWWSCCVLLLGVLLLGVGCKGAAEKKAGAKGWGSWKRKARPKPVHGVQVRRGNISSILAGTTTLKAEESVSIITQVNGLVKRVVGVEGRKFRRGATLAVLDNPYLHIAFEKADLQVKKLIQDLKKQRRLSRRGYVSKETVDELKFRLAQAENERKRALQNLKDLRIRATIRGVVTLQNLRKGAWVQPNQQAFGMEDTNSLMAHIAVPEKYMPHLKQGLRALLVAEALGRDKSISGEVVRISPVVDSKTGTMTVTIGKLSPLERLRSGMFVAVKLILETHKQVPLIPKQAILYDSNKPMVYRILGDVSTCRSKSMLGEDSAETTLKSESGKSKGPKRPKRRRRRGGKRGKWKKGSRRGKKGRRRGKKGGKWKKGGEKESQGCVVEKVFFEKGIEDSNWVEVRGGLKEGDVVVSLGQDDLHTKSKVLVGKLR